MRILMFGRTGQLASEMRDRAAAAGVELIALGREEADLAHPQAAGAAVDAYEGAQLVVNAAAYTAVDGAEAEEAQATTINGAAPGAIARACARRGIPFIHLSTDYVFDGAGERPWRETDAPGPLGAYGRSKLAGEQAVAEAGGQSLVLRTAWVFSAHGRNFVKTMLRLGREQGAVRVVDDQTGRPTYAGDIADFILRTAAPALGRGEGTGLYHLAGVGEVTWRGFAEAVFEAAGMDVTVTPIATADFPTPAKRPRSSVLDTGRLERDFGVRLRPWREGLAETVAALRAEETP